MYVMVPYCPIRVHHEYTVKIQYMYHGSVLHCAGTPWFILCITLLEELPNATFKNTTDGKAARIGLETKYRLNVSGLSFGKDLCLLIQ